MNTNEVQKYCRQFKSSTQNKLDVFTQQTVISRKKMDTNRLENGAAVTESLRVAGVMVQMVNEYGGGSEDKGVIRG